LASVAEDMTFFRVMLTVWMAPLLGRKVGRWFFGISRFGAEVEVAADAAASFAFGEVRGITVDLHNHGGGIVEEANKGLGSFFGAIGLRGSKCPKCYKHCSIDCPRVVEEHANNLLESRDAFGQELGGCVEEGRELDDGSIVRFQPGMM
jgi:hypothetical protein